MLFWKICYLNWTQSHYACQCPMFCILSNKESCESERFEAMFPQNVCHINALICDVNLCNDIVFIISWWCFQVWWMFWLMRLIIMISHFVTMYDYDLPVHLLCLIFTRCYTLHCNLCYNNTVTVHNVLCFYAFVDGETTRFCLYAVCVSLCHNLFVRAASGTIHHACGCMHKGVNQFFFRASSTF